MEFFIIFATMEYKNKYGEIPEIGKVFNKWVVVDNTVVMVGRLPRQCRGVLCRCSCGSEKVVRISALFKGKSKSCSCASGLRQKEKAMKNAAGNVTYTVYAQIRHCAERRDISFNVTMQDLWDLFLLQNGKCALSGIPLILNTKPGPDSTASLDRINSKMCYQQGNIQWVHKDINKMKSDFSDERLIELCRLIVENNPA